MWVKLFIQKGAYLTLIMKLITTCSWVFVLSIVLKYLTNFRLTIKQNDSPVSLNVHWTLYWIKYHPSYPISYSLILLHNVNLIPNNTIKYDILTVATIFIWLLLFRFVCTWFLQMCLSSTKHRNHSFTGEKYMTQFIFLNILYINLIFLKLWNHSTSLSK